MIRLLSKHEFFLSSRSTKSTKIWTHHFYNASSSVISGWEEEGNTSIIKGKAEEATEDKPHVVIMQS